MKKSKVVKIITLYPPGEVYGDYYGIHILIDDKVVQEYGDSYHDSGYEKSEGYVDCLKNLYPDIEVKEFDAELHDETYSSWKITDYTIID